MAMIKSIFKNKWYPPADPEHISFAARTIIVTGSSSGLGAEAAYKFAAQGAARLILAVRNEEKGAKAQKLIQHLASDPKCKVDVWKLDMLDYDSIKAFAKRCDDELDRLDIAVLNAGVFSATYKQSRYGWEETLQVNTLSTTLLALLILPKMKASRTADFTPVLELVSSGRHYAAQLSDAQKTDGTVNVLEDFNKQEGFSSGILYRTSKLFLMYAMQSLAQSVQQEGAKPEVVITSACPGACQSDLARGMDSLALRAAKMAANSFFLRTAEEGSRAFVSAIDQGEAGHGSFWQNDTIRAPPDLLQGETGESLRQKVYGEIYAALEKDIPDLQAIVKS